MSTETERKVAVALERLGTWSDSNYAASSEARWHDINIVARALSEPAVPEGWKLVPVEPDEKMCKCGDSHWSMFAIGINQRPAARKLYRAMLATAPEPDKDALGKARVALSRPAMNDDPIVQVSGFGVENTSNTQCNYMLTAVTRSGRVLMSVGDGEWSDVGPKAAAPEPDGEES